MDDRETSRPPSAPPAHTPGSPLELTLGGAPAGALRPAHSLRRRFVLAIVALVGFVLLALAGVLVLTSRSTLRRDLEAHAESHAALTAGPLCDAYVTYHSSGYSKFREVVGALAARNPDLAELAIYDTTGRLLFRSSELRDPLGAPPVPTAPPAVAADERLRQAIRGLRLQAWRETAPAGESYRVVVPYVEDWGRHRYTAVFDVSYASLAAALRDLGVRMAWLTAASLALATLIAVLLARPILRPLSALTAGATALAEGRLDTRLQVTTGDELEVLARTFNHMAARLAASIDDLEASNRALSRSNVELLELDRLKSDLLANVSHELRTPLTSVKGWLEALAEELLGPLNETQREALEVSRRNLDHQLHLIAELLSYARFEAGAMHLERRPTDLAAIARPVVDRERAARGRELDLRFEVEPELPLADGDGERLAQVIDNLVTNAVKFTPAGGRVTVTLSRAGDDVVVAVADTGIGIAREEHARIFERFYQVQSSSTRGYGGIGLGLAIVRQILDAHGCAIELDSAPGRGSTFRFRVPVAAAGESGGAGGPLLALVDADVAFARALAEHLTAAGWRVRIAGSFAGAERLVREARPRLVVLDRLLPDGDGFDLIARWRRHHDARQLTILVISLRDEEPLARRLGADGYLVKPVAPGVVQTAIEGLLARAATEVASTPGEAVS